MNGRGGDWQVVAVREIWVKLRDKVFIGSTLFVVAAVVVSVGLSAFLSNWTDSYTVAVVDRAGGALVDTARSVADEQGRKVELTTEVAPDDAAAEALVASADVDVALLPAGDGWEVVAEREVDPGLQELLATAVSSQSLERNAQRLGTNQDELLAGSTLDARVLEGSTLAPEVRYGVGFAFALLFYVTALTFGLAIAQSVVEEKQSRVVEILAAAIPIRQLLLGKVVGNSALALAQVVTLVGVGMVALSLTGQSEFLAPVLAAGTWFVVFFLLGFAAVACVWAVAGSVATRSEDLQATTTPVTVSVMAALFVGLFAQGKVLAVASFVPLVSSVAMPIRMLGGDVPWWQPVVSGVIVLVAAAGLVRLGARMYENSLLRTDRRTSWREALQLTR